MQEGPCTRRYLGLEGLHVRILDTAFRYLIHLDWDRKRKRPFGRPTDCGACFGLSGQSGPWF